jgi:hypothetical protein
MIRKEHIKLSICTLLAVLVMQMPALGNIEIGLKGSWKFMIGDDMARARPDYDDSNWERIMVPARWEEQGYRGYDGYAWYRNTISIPTDLQNREVILELGYIDDVDEVFFNGNKIGQTGSFPPRFSTAYNAQRRYRVPSSIIQFGKINTIAVRVYDAQLEGGIVRGDIKLTFGDVAILPDIDMNGYWNFNTGKEPIAKSEKIIVPGAWENQGYFNYDGYAVYSRVVNVPEKLARQKLVFMAGRIDDDDQLYINGQFIGETGNYQGSSNSDMYREFRNYFIPDGVIKPGNNLVVIKVVDRGGEGGILEGNVGFIAQDNFIKYWRMRRRNP